MHRNSLKGMDFDLDFIGLKGMNFDPDFVHSFPLFSSLMKKREEGKENKVVKILIKSHTFQTDQCRLSHRKLESNSFSKELSDMHTVKRG